LTGGEMLVGASVDFPAALQAGKDSRCRVVWRGQGDIYSIVPSAGNFRKKSSKPAPINIGEGGLGSFRTGTSKPRKFANKKVPNLGNLKRKSSKLWKFREKKFQALEILKGKSSKLWKFLVSRLHAPPGPGMALTESSVLWAVRDRRDLPARDVKNRKEGCGQTRNSPGNQQHNNRQLDNHYPPADLLSVTRPPRDPGIV